MSLLPYCLHCLTVFCFPLPPPREGFIYNEFLRSTWLQPRVEHRRCQGGLVRIARALNARNIWTLILKVTGRQRLFALKRNESQWLAQRKQVRNTGRMNSVQLWLVGQHWKEVLGTRLRPAWGKVSSPGESGAEGCAPGSESVKSR
ncbi:hypothetical protein P7K49_039837, partial [Saguinus oedipus]